jgi:hypothetical protein
VVNKTCDTGSTVKLALSELRVLRPAEVRSAVSFKTGEYAPDFHAFETDNFIILPWDQEIIQGGELIVRPDYAARLSGQANDSTHCRSFLARSHRQDPRPTGQGLV